MEINKILFAFILLLLSMLLLLKIVIHVIILWILVIFLRYHISLWNKAETQGQKKESKDIVEKEKNARNDMPNEQYQVVREPKKSDNTIIKDVVCGDYGDDEKENFAREQREIKTYDNWTELKREIKNLAENRELKEDNDNEENLKYNCLRVNATNAIEVNESRCEAQYSASLNGKILIYEKNIDGFLAKPIETVINEKEYLFDGLSSCFNLNQEIRSGYLYEIISVKKPCIMTKKEESYFVKEKGELEIRKK